MKIVVIVLVVNTLPLFLLNEYNLDIHSYPFFRYLYTSESPISVTNSYVLGCFAAGSHTMPETSTIGVILLCSKFRTLKQNGTWQHVVIIGAQEQIPRVSKVVHANNRSNEYINQGL